MLREQQRGYESMRRKDERGFLGKGNRWSNVSFQTCTTCFSNAILKIPSTTLDLKCPYDNSTSLLGRRICLMYEGIHIMHKFTLGIYYFSIILPFSSRLEGWTFVSFYGLDPIFRKRNPWAWIIGNYVASLSGCF
jgi:hypothetical protein